MNSKPLVQQLELISLDSPTSSPENPTAAKLAAEQPFVSVPRVRRPNRGQVECLPFALDELLPEEHEARAVWDFVEGQKLPVLVREDSGGGRKRRAACNRSENLSGALALRDLEGRG